jgi:regulator of PEP synthase PpsR (kinase-PPPase family)
LMHQVDDGYFERLEALAFAVRNDDSRRSEELPQADIILLGLSRTSKTPLSIYLAQEGWRVANIPLSVGEDPSKELAEVDQKRIVGLIANAEQLSVVRKARLSRLGTKDSSYADAGQIEDELGYCRTLFAQHPEWLVVDVTGKCVEEVASEILDRLFGKERRV